MTPAELRERRRDRDLRAQWLASKRDAEILRLRSLIGGIEDIKPTYPQISNVLDLAIDAANLAISSLERIQRATGGRA